MNNYFVWIKNNGKYWWEEENTSFEDDKIINEEDIFNVKTTLLEDVKFAIDVKIGKIKMFFRKDYITPPDFLIFDPDDEDIII